MATLFRPFHAYHSGSKICRILHIVPLTAAAQGSVLCMGGEDFSDSRNAGVGIAVREVICIQIDKLVGL